MAPIPDQNKLNGPHAGDAFCKGQLEEIGDPVLARSQALEGFVLAQGFACAAPLLSPPPLSSG